jgi:hypothetical protein
MYLDTAFALIVALLINLTVISSFAELFFSPGFNNTCHIFHNKLFNNRSVFIYSSVCAELYSTPMACVTNGATTHDTTATCQSGDGVVTKTVS